MSAPRKLAAILAADVAGYSRLIGLDEEGTLKRLRKLRRELINPAVTLHRGRIVKTTGDGILIEFPSVVDAVRCAVDVQRGMLRTGGRTPIFTDREDGSVAMAHAEHEGPLGPAGGSCQRLPRCPEIPYRPRSAPGELGLIGAHEGRNPCKRS
jgi:hypothetical protein